MRDLLSIKRKQDTGAPYSPTREALLGTALTLLILLAAWFLASQWFKARLIKEKRADSRAEASLMGNGLAASLERRMSLMRGLEAFVMSTYPEVGFDRRFNSYAAGLYATEGIHSISVAPEGMPRYVYPPGGNEAVLGYDPLNDPDPEVQADVERALETQAIILTGPVELLQGGAGLIARQAIYQDGRFWGMTSIVFDLPLVLDRAGLNREPGDLIFALRDENGRQLYGDPGLFELDPILYVVVLPDGQWDLAGAPTVGWTGAIAPQLRIFEAAGLLVVLLGTGIAHLTINNQSRLKWAVEQRTREISRINQELQDDISQRKRVEAALRESQNQLSDILYIAADAIIAIDENQDIILFNQAAQKTFGYHQEDVLGQPLDLLIPERFVDLHRKYIEAFSTYPESHKHMSGQRREVYGRRKDGSEFPAEASISRTTQNNRMTFTVVVRDITERKQAEADLRSSEARQRALLNAIPDMMFRIDREGSYLDFHVEHESDLAVPADQIIGMNIRQVLRAPGLADTILEKTKQALQTNEMQVSEYSLEMPSGLRHYEARQVKSSQDEVVVIVRDVTERVAAFHLLEQRVAERTRELATLLQVSQNVASTLKLEPLLSLILEQIREVVDYTALSVFILEDESELVLVEYQGPLSKNEVPGRWNFQEHLAGSDLVEMRQPVVIPDVRANSVTGVWQRLFSLQFDQGPVNTASWMGVPLLVKDRLIGILSFEHAEPDHFSSHHGELALAFANQAAIAIENARLYEQAQALAALQERQRLARELHDSVSQALYGIVLGARTAREVLKRVEVPGEARASLQEPVEYMLSLAEAGLTEMRALIFELRPETLEKEGLAWALSRQIAALQTRHHIPVKTELCDEPEIRLEAKEALYRVAQEALNNVVKHAQAAQARVCLQCQDGLVTLEVCDDGIGFDVTASFPGHLGLHTMSERIEKLGGRLNIASQPGQGTCIQASLPIKA